MKELNEEIKLTINTMQCDIDDGAHGELQSHLYSLLEMKRSELQKRLVECKIEYVALDQAHHKSVKLDGKIADEDKPLTADELKAGGWWCGDTSEACRIALESIGFKFFVCSWYSEFDACFVADPEAGTIGRGSETNATSTLKLKQIYRDGNEFYWGGK